MASDNGKQLILERFQELSWHLGLKRVTVNMLARECGISKKTLYTHFKDKNEIARLSMDRFLDGIRGHILKLDQAYDNPFEKLTHLFELSLNVADDMPEVLLYDIKHFYPEIQKEMDSLFEEITENSMDYLKTGAQMGVFKDIHAGLITSFVQGAATGVFSTDCMLKHGLSAEDAISGFRALLLTGLLKT